MKRARRANRPGLTRPRGAALLCLLLVGACTRDGDDGYTALLRYNIADFRVAGISASLVDTSNPLPLPLPGTEVELRAVMLQGSDEPPELEWLDCPSFIYEGQDLNLEGAISNIDCLGTPSEIRLGRGTSITYRIRDSGQGVLPFFEDGGRPGPPDAAPPLPDGGPPGPPGRDEEPIQIEVDDAVVFLRASSGDVVRYGQKTFLGLFVPGRARPFIDGLSVDGEPRDNLETRVLHRAPGERVRVRFEAVGVAENRMVQWFVTGGELQRHGLTYYTDVDSRVVGSERLPTAEAQNTWVLPKEAGVYELLAVIGGDFAELPHVRVRVEVQP